MREPPASAADPHALALAALGWVLADDVRADRLLSLTGLTPESLRAGIDDPALLAAVLEHLCAHEPELVAAAGGIGATPQALCGARDALLARAFARHDGGAGA